MNWNKRNIVILIATIAIGATTFGLVVYSLENYYQPINNNSVDTTPVLLVIEGPILPVKVNITQHMLTTNYTVVTNGMFSGLNSVGSTLSGEYTGAEVYDILNKTGVLANNPTNVTFEGSDGYSSPVLNIADFQQYPSQVIIAWAQQGQTLKPQSQGGDGPLRSVVNITVAPALATPYWVKYCTIIYVQ